ncbi:MAG: CsbD family protein [Hyphomonadaceae bacterium]|nr:CsbD family protein [Hyphomonadaceae bacterium]
MNWQQIEGKWDQLRGAAQKQWGKLTDDDMAVARGSRDEFVGRVKERYGIAKEEAERQVDEFMRRNA